MRRLLPLILVLLALVAAALWFWARRPHEPAGLVLTGTIEARVVELGSLVGGRVSRVLVDEGAEVAFGATILILESDLLDRQIEGPRRASPRRPSSLALAERRSAQREARERAKIAWSAAEDRPPSDRGALSRRRRRSRRVRRARSFARRPRKRAGRRPIAAAAAKRSTRRAPPSPAPQAQLAYLERQRHELTVIAPVAGRIEVVRPAARRSRGAEPAGGDAARAGRALGPGLRPGDPAGRGRARSGGHDRASTAFAGRTFPGRVVEIRHRAEYLPRNVQTLDQRADQVFGVKVAITPAPELRPGMAATVALSGRGERSRGDRRPPRARRPAPSASRRDECLARFRVVGAGGVRALDRVSLAVRARRDLRPARPQRLGQVDPHPHPLRPARADRRASGSVDGLDVRRPRRRRSAATSATCRRSSRSTRT